MKVLLNPSLLRKKPPQQLKFNNRIDVGQKWNAENLLWLLLDAKRTLIGNESNQFRAT